MMTFLTVNLARANFEVQLPTIGCARQGTFNHSRLNLCVQYKKIAHRAGGSFTGSIRLNASRTLAISGCPFFGKHRRRGNERRQAADVLRPQHYIRALRAYRVAETRLSPFAD
jgi:hypothetical protein